MIKQSRWRQIICGAASVVLIAMAFMVLWELPVEEPPLAIRVYTPSDCIVEVSNYLPDGLCSYGKGVVVNHGNETFVLTSSMILTHEGDYRINTHKTEIIHQNEVYGLVAFRCPLKMAAVSLDDAPNLPSGIEVWAGDVVQILEYINDDWVIIIGDLSMEDTGMPVEVDGGLVGIIIGLNCINTSQAIMVGNRAIVEFCNEF